MDFIILQLFLSGLAALLYFMLIRQIAVSVNKSPADDAIIYIASFTVIAALATIWFVI
jgi:hypothetical protein